MPPFLCGPPKSNNSAKVTGLSLSAVSLTIRGTPKIQGVVRCDPTRKVLGLRLSGCYSPELSNWAAAFAFKEFTLIDET